MSSIQVLGTGSYLPEMKLNNSMLEKIVETSDEWIQSRTGIQTRHLSDGEPVWAMGSKASKQALATSGLKGNEIDVIIASTITPDYHTPSLSCIIQEELDADHAFCLDINTACSGYVYAYDLAMRYLSDPDIRNVLIVCSEKMSGITDYTDRKTCVLFGDGAGATVLTREDTEGSTDAMIRSMNAKKSVLGSEGKLGKHIISCATYGDHPFRTEGSGTPERFPVNNGTAVYMGGQDVYKFAVRVFVNSIRKLLDQNSLTMDDITWVVPHQANDRILEASAKRLDVDSSKMVSYISDLGNTSSASIPITLDRMIADGRLKRGDLIVLCGFGGGLTYGAALMQY